jgi:hypothetical protein
MVLEDGKAKRVAPEVAWHLVKAFSCPHLGTSHLENKHPSLDHSSFLYQATNGFEGPHTHDLI